MATRPAQDDGMTLADILTLARKREVNVAMVIGKEGLAVAGDPRKPPEVMWREAKKIGGGAKGGMGTCTVQGKELHFRLLNDDVPATLKKALKARLRDAGLKFKVMLFLPDGTVDGDDGDEDGAAGDPAAELVAALRDEFDRLMTGFETLRPVVPAPVVKKIDGLATMFAAELMRDARKANAVLGLVRKTLEDYGAQAEKGLTPDFVLAERRRTALAEIETRIDALLAEFA